MRRLARDDGQILPLLVTGLLVVLLGVAALVVDIGRAYVVKRQLQSTADAAALAAADDLPDAAKALATATVFGPANKNPVPGVEVTQTARAWCLKSQVYCYGNPPRSAPANGQANGIVVQESAQVPTTFAKVFGIDTINVNAKSTACGMCTSQPLDIALVVDRTGSMGDNMSDLQNGVKTFLRALDPRLDYVTLLALPPSISPSLPCLNDFGTLYGRGGDSYTLTRMSNDYKVNGVLNPNSDLVKKVDCLIPLGATAYKDALVAAHDELTNHGSGRPNVQKVIVFETDGAANTAPTSFYDRVSDGSDTRWVPLPSHLDDVLRPCGSSVDYVNNVVKPAGTFVVTVSYALRRDEDCYQAPHSTRSGTRWDTTGYRTERESTSAGTALSQMASTGGAFTQAGEGDMSAVFQKIANKLTSATLVPDEEAD
jgi:hypothetical protein